MAAEGALLEAKLAELGLEQSPEEFVAGLQPHIKRRVEHLQGLQKQRDDIEGTYRKELAELTTKYEKLYGPLYSQRAELVSGAKDVPPKEGEPAGDANVKGIPEFWTTVLLKCDTTAEMIKDKDLEVLKHLQDIQSETLLEDGTPRGFKLSFFFGENPFFTNKVLEKKYLMHSEDDDVLEKAEGTKIEWNAGKDVTVKIMKKKAKKGGKDAKPQIKMEKVESFFNFFSPPVVPEEDEEVDEETMEELQALVEADYEVGATIKEKLVAKAVSWYTGEAIEDEPYMFGGEDEDYDGEEGDEDEDEEDDDDDEPPMPRARGGRGGAGGAGRGSAGGRGGGGAAGGEQPPECKQQ